MLHQQIRKAYNRIERTANLMAHRCHKTLLHRGLFRQLIGLLPELLRLIHFIVNHNETEALLLPISVQQSVDIHHKRMSLAILRGGNNIHCLEILLRMEQRVFEFLDTVFHIGKQLAQRHLVLAELKCPNQVLA